jgi:hypothetical protein
MPVPVGVAAGAKKASKILSWLASDIGLPSLLAVILNLLDNSFEPHAFCVVTDGVEGKSHKRGLQ